MGTQRPHTFLQILVNQSYRMQRITGQQRYASEIASRLLTKPTFGQTSPSPFWSASALRVWTWLQFVLPITARDAVLLSMTARAPAFHRRQILVVHDLFVLTNPEWFSRQYVLSHAPLLRAQLARAAGIVAVSAPVADQVAPLYRGPIVVAPNAPSAVFSAPIPADDSTLAGRGLTPGSYFLAVGSLDPRKNLPRLAAAYGQLSDEERQKAPLVVVGGGSAVYKSQNIHWPTGTVDAGYVSDEELRALYAGSRAVVFVSLAEGFGLPLVEAAAAGAPALLISDIAVFRWICGDRAHYVDPLSVGSIAGGLRAAIDAATAHDEPRSPLVEPGRYSWDASAAIVAGLCEQVQGAGATPAALAESTNSTTAGR